jgi:hypothetical protein
MTDFAQKLGTTRSSKPILQPVNIDSETLKDMTSDYELGDHFDAYAVYQYLLARELATLGRDSPRLKVYDVIGRFHRDRVEKVEIHAQMTALSLTTIFDVIKFGQSRADPFFQ